MYCSSCGTELEGTAKFCQECGVSLDDSSKQKEIKEDENNVNKSKERIMIEIEEVKEKGGQAMTGGLTLMFFAFGGIFAGSFLNSDGLFIMGLFMVIISIISIISGFRKHKKYKELKDQL